MRGISFTPDMVQAIIDGHKTQTRRKIGSGAYKVGEVLYIKEQWLKNKDASMLAEGRHDSGPEGWRRFPAMFMPRKLARYYIEIMAVREQRLQEINEIEAKAEGMKWDDRGGPINLFRAKWESFRYTAKGYYAWKNNPTVRVYEFEIVDGGRFNP